MTDRPALAQQIVLALREELGALVFDDDAVPVVARVLAEHETAEASARQLIGDVLETSAVGWNWLCGVHCHACLEELDRLVRTAQRGFRCEA